MSSSDLEPRDCVLRLRFVKMAALLFLYASPALRMPAPVMQAGPMTGGPAAAVGTELSGRVEPTKAAEPSGGRSPETRRSCTVTYCTQYVA